MRTGMLLAMLAMLLRRAHCLSDRVRRIPSGAFAVDATSGVTLSARLGSRCAALGPRREVLESILVADRTEDSAWSDAWRLSAMKA